MSFCSLRRTSRMLRHPLLLITLIVALALPASGNASSSFGPKVSSSLAAVAGASGTTSSTPLHAIVFGSNPAQGNTAGRSLIQVRQPLGVMGGESVTVADGSLPLLAAEAGVSYVTL